LLFEAENPAGNCLKWRSVDRFAHFIIHHKKFILIAFIAAAAVSAVLSLLVGVNYNMVDYLPPSAQSTRAIEIMEKEFGGAMPNTNVMVKGVSIQQALAYKQELESVDGVREVLWLDDTVDLKQPIEMADTATVENFYKNENALFSVTVDKGEEPETIDAIRDVIGADNQIAGEAPDLVTVQRTTGAEVGNALAILLPIIIIILILASASWIEPLLFIASIGIAVLLNMGTNIFFGEISFMTNSISPILQLAVSMDYAIFLLHSFAHFRKTSGDVNEAMRRAIRASMSTIAASAATTLFGFLALTFMDFRIGSDLGLTLAKGIVLSFVTTMVFMPALILFMVKLIDKTKHRRLMPRFNNVNKGFSKIAIPALLLIVIFIVPSFLGQSRTEFIYGNGSVGEVSESGRDKAEIRDEFGQSTVMALLVPRGEIAKESDLSREIEQVGHVTSVLSYANTVGEAFPPEFLGADVTEQFYSDKYARIIVYTDTPEEGDTAFSAVREITKTAKSYYGDAVYAAGQSANIYDMKNVVERDNRIVTLIAAIAIFLVLLITFGSATLPFILLLTIEAGIWINLAIPYFTGTSINFLGYLVLNTVQLGATIDYAILLTNTYMGNRKLMPQAQAIHASLGSAFPSILVSATTLSAAGFTLYATSSNPAVSDIGLLLGRGTLLSLAMVTCFLPAMLRLFDKAIAKTTYKAGFAPAKMGAIKSMAQGDLFGGGEK
jgi:predicted RND superfamily exporter protein